MVDIVRCDRCGGRISNIMRMVQVGKRTYCAHCHVACLSDILTDEELDEMPFPTELEGEIYRCRVCHWSVLPGRGCLCNELLDDEPETIDDVTPALDPFGKPINPVLEAFAQKVGEEIEARCPVSEADPLQDKRGEWPCLQFEDDNEMIFWSDYARAFAHGRASCSHDGQSYMSEDGHFSPRPTPAQVCAESVEYADGMLLEERRRSKELALARLEEERMDAE